MTWLDLPQHYGGYDVRTGLILILRYRARVLALMTRSVPLLAQQTWARRWKHQITRRWRNERADVLRQLKSMGESATPTFWKPLLAHPKDRKIEARYLKTNIVNATPRLDYEVVTS